MKNEQFEPTIRRKEDDLRNNLIFSTQCRKCDDGVEETEEVTPMDTDGQILASETYAWRREGTGRADDGWEGQ